MREIKFRGMRSDRPEWVYGYYIAYYVTGGGDLYHHIKNPDNTYSVKTETISQYTGLKDKNGKEIYESDLVQFKYYNVYQRWWSTTEEIPTIEAECEKQRNDVKIGLSVVTYDRGCFILKGGYPATLVDVSNGYRLKRGQTSSCDFEEKQWDFEVIGNIYENPELLKETL